ncbi:MAG: CoA transferase [Chloroflexi bacterium]|nr:CoA transferase [Chloroflexota bacterium]
MSGSALDDICVVDLSQGVPGGYCTKLLTDFGAQVIKVEPVHGEATRHVGPFPAGPPGAERGALPLYLNGGKKSITLEIQSATGRQLLCQLVQRADVLVESFLPGALAGLGLDYPALQKLNSRLVMCSITYFGQVGPYRDFLGSDLIALALSSYLDLTGDPDKPPLRTGGSQAEYQAGLNAAIAIMSALSYRDDAGVGQYLDVSAIEAVLSTYDGTALLTMEERTGHAPKRRGTRLQHRDPHAAYPSTLLPCKDGWVHAHWSPSNPEGLAFLTGNPRLADPEVMDELMGHADEIDELLAAWLKDHTRDEVMALAQEVRVPFTKVQSIDEVLEDPQNQATGFFVPVEHPEAGTLRYPGSPMHMPASTCRTARAPLLGEHTEEVLCNLLELGADDVLRLRAEGSI